MELVKSLISEKFVKKIKSYGRYETRIYVYVYIVWQGYEIIYRYKKEIPFNRLIVYKKYLGG